jgi:hypothetical protein
MVLLGYAIGACHAGGSMRFSVKIIGIVAGGVGRRARHRVLGPKWGRDIRNHADVRRRGGDHAIRSRAGRSSGRHDGRVQCAGHEQRSGHDTGGAQPNSPGHHGCPEAGGVAAPLHAPYPRHAHDRSAGSLPSADQRRQVL